MTRGATSGALVASVKNRDIREVSFAMCLTLGEQFVHGDQLGLWMEAWEVSDVSDMFVVLLQLQLVLVEC